MSRQYQRGLQDAASKTGGRAFPAFHQAEHKHKNEQVQDIYGTSLIIPKTFVTRTNEEQQGPGTVTTQQILATMADMTEILMEEQEPPTQTPMVATSIVEQALQQASGMKVPMKCFGCDGIPEYDNGAYHLWRNCPHKSEQRVWRNFQKNLKIFREKKAQRKEQSYGPASQAPATATHANWFRDGYPSAEVKDLLQAAANPNISSPIRRTFITSLKQALDQVNLEANTIEHDQEGAPSITKRKSTTQHQEGPTRKTGRSFLMYSKVQEDVPTTFLTQHPLRRYPLKVAFELPFLTFPIGDGTTPNDTGTLTGLLDTGGCCSMGNLNYFEELHRVFPQYFVDLFPLQEKQFEDINIGGIKSGIWLTHIAILWIPYEEHNRTCTIEFGLSSELPVDALYGVQFIKEAKLVPRLAERRCESGLFQDSYDITWMTPKNKPIERIAAEKGNPVKTFILKQEAEGE